MAELSVLVAEDQASMRALLCSALRSIGIKKVYTADDGREALTILKRERPTLLLLDVEMPNMSGVETLAELRRDYALAAMPVIMVTGRATPELVKTTTELGVSGYLLKPVTPDALKTRIYHALSAGKKAAV